MPLYYGPFKGRSATYIIAASDAPAHVKAQADKVCDGVADQEEMQWAIDAANAAGEGDVLFHGTIILSDEFVMKSNVWLHGSVGATIKLANTFGAAGVYDYAIVGGADGANLSNVKLSDFKFDGNYANQGHITYLRGMTIFADGLTVRNVWGINHKSWAIGVCQGSSDVKVTENIIKSSQFEAGIWLDGTSGKTIKTALVEGNSVDDSARGIVCKYCDHPEVVHNTVTNVKVGGGNDAIYFDNCEDPICHDNQIDVCEEGIILHGYNKKPTVKGNHIKNNTYRGIASINSLYEEDTNIEGNIVEAYPMVGKHTGANNASVLTDSTKSWIINIFAGVPGYHMTIYNLTDGSSGEVVSNTATTVTATLAGGTDHDWDTDDLYVINPSYGIEIGNDTVSALISGNRVLSPSSIGIKVNGLGGGGVTTRIIVIGNEVLDSQKTGMRIENSVGVIANNMVLNSNQGNSVAGYDQIGIYLHNVLNSVISGNKAYDDQEVKTQRYGIVEGGGSDYNIIQGNNVIGNSVAGIVPIGAATRVRDNQGYTTENSGTATGTGAVSIVAVNHGLAAIPARVFVQAQQGGQGDYWISAKEATTFTITFVTQPGAATWYFDWHAQVGEG